MLFVARRKKNYVAELKRQMAECDANYLRLMRLLPDLERCEHWQFAISDESVDLGVLNINVTERSRYTTLLRIYQQDPWGEWLDQPELSVRLYHDARMAEVVGYQKQRHFEGRYLYPNPKMRQPDEKLQINLFLGEWLAHLQQYGHSVAPVALPQ
ncbi:hypothetical protein SAMN02745127_00712 [Oceanospirillum multiglobuliferum]|uniref:Cytoplasmic protein n=1 Tax=Oceanospirillum multiglobuliferum TaxID=64969 RepID=A0A1T4M944_9GAMM|nr:DUF1249 domain-containing protein [Oceanospirillum multiglobuliferum]OPX56200.1 hypothetical protein BTE48_04265 [Oceanospirillum multiglobuliferum]SJZ63452.1 hypothetical protein SAMN02745127_00712 [Oceanospirillum multiglobuliferum]